MNPLHVDAEYAAHSMFKERIAHGMLVAGLISAVLGTTAYNQRGETVIDGNAVVKKVACSPR